MNQLLIGDIAVEGISVAGQETCLMLPRHKVAFDFGRCPRTLYSYPTVCLTHGHVDHVGGLPAYVGARCLAGLPTSRVCLPPGLQRPVEQLIAAHEELGQHTMQCNLHTLQDGDEFMLSSNLCLKPFPTVHRVPSQGYCLYKRVSRLKAQYQGLSQKDVGVRIKAGEVVSESTWVPEFAFTGDTTLEWMDKDHPVTTDALHAKVLAMEMTYLDEKVPLAKAQETGHSHLLDLCHRYDALQKVGALVLVHFSARYKQSDILQHLQDNLPSGLMQRTHALLEGYR